jgi:ankyrin repeat protein
LVAAIRPLHVEELAEIFAIGFDQGATRDFMEGWRPENPEEAILSACSTLITVIDDAEGSKVVQFSHFSVKEFLVSERLRTLEVGSIRDFHIRLDTAHTTLARVCLTILLQLDKKIDKKRLATYPLALYAAQHWFNHAKYEGVASQVQDAMEQLFDPSRPYLAAWVWIYDVDQGLIRRSIDALSDRPSPPTATPLYYATSCGLSGLMEYLISMRDEDVNFKYGGRGTPLHAASRNGHLSAVSLLLDHGADLKMTNDDGWTALCEAYGFGHIEVMRILLDRGAAADRHYNEIGFMTHDASYKGRVDSLRLLLQHGADVNATETSKRTPLHWAAASGHVNAPQVLRVLLEHGADINALSIYGTPLARASDNQRLECARFLLEHGADVHIRDPSGQTAFQMARQRGYVEIAQLLLGYGAKEE